MQNDKEYWDRMKAPLRDGAGNDRTDRRIAVVLDGDGLVADFEKEVEAMGYRPAGGVAIKGRAIVYLEAI